MINASVSHAGSFSGDARAANAAAPPNEEAGTSEEGGGGDGSAGEAEGGMRRVRPGRTAVGGEVGAGCRRVFSQDRTGASAATLLRLPRGSVSPKVAASAPSHEPASTWTYCADGTRGGIEARGREAERAGWERAGWERAGCTWVEVEIMAAAGVAASCGRGGGTSPSAWLWALVEAPPPENVALSLRAEVALSLWEGRLVAVGASGGSCAS